MKLRRVFSIGVLALLLVVGVGLGLYFLFDAEGGDSVWPEVVSATSTLALVVVTGSYVWLTYRLVKIQSDPGIQIRAQVREDAMASIATAISKAAMSLRILVDESPFDDLKSFPNQVVLNNQERLGPLADVLTEREHFLPPSMATLASRLHQELIMAESNFLRLGYSIGVEKARADAAGEDWTTEGARLAYYGTVREQFPTRRPEWDDLVNGENYRRAHALAGLLADAIRQGYVGD